MIRSDAGAESRRGELHSQSSALVPLPASSCRHGSRSKARGCGTESGVVTVQAQDPSAGRQGWDAWQMCSNYDINWVGTRFRHQSAPEITALVQKRYPRFPGCVIITLLTKGTLNLKNYFSLIANSSWVGGTNRTVSFSALSPAN